MSWRKFKESKIWNTSQPCNVGTKMSVHAHGAQTIQDGVHDALLGSD
jgi:hypothetical protein